MKLYTEYKVCGRNFGRYLSALKRRKIRIEEARVIDDKTMLITVEYKDNEKFFAITKDLCYNITKTRDKGLLLPFLYLYKNFGILLGAVALIALLVVANDYIFAIEYTGSGLTEKVYVERFFEEKGIGTFTRFSDLDYKKLASEIMRDSDAFSFVSVKKSGNRLTVNLTQNSKKYTVLSGGVKELACEKNGQIESIKVYKGQTSYKEKDFVKKGDIIVWCGENCDNVIASVVLIHEYKKSYILNNDSEDLALMFCENDFSLGEIVDQSVIKNNCGQNYIYTVTIKYRQVYNVG